MMLQDSVQTGRWVPGINPEMSLIGGEEEGKWA